MLDNKERLGKTTEYLKKYDKLKAARDDAKVNEKNI